MTKNVVVESTSKVLQAIRYTRGKLELLDQRKLPHESIYLDILNSEIAWNAIKDMVVRGAPAIAISAALALAVELTNQSAEHFPSKKAALEFIVEKLEYLVSSRPTAVNLADAAAKLKYISTKEEQKEDASAENVVLAYVTAAEAMLEDDVAANKSIGKFGAEALLKAAVLDRQESKSQKKNAGESDSAAEKSDSKISVLTHCNTGSLATAAYGTALGVIRSLFYDGALKTAFCTETRPYNQGSRLTAFELVHDGIPATLITDSSAASLMASGKVDAVVVGADRIAANGDTANKIGTFSLSLSAFHHNVPFFIAAPTTSIDLSIKTGEEIIIEERPSYEITHALVHRGVIEGEKEEGDWGEGEDGEKMKENKTPGVHVAAPGIQVWNPSFDVTPAQFITGIITEKGVIYKRGGYSVFDIPAFIKEKEEIEREREKERESASEKTEEEREDDASHPDFHAKRLEEDAELAKRFFPLNETTVGDYLTRHYPDIAATLGGTGPSDWKVKEVGDGNINFVYVLEGPTGSIVMKQALPYVRCVGESWPMTLQRIFYEATTLREQYALCPEHVPQVFAFHHSMALIVMRYIEPPHIILRRGFIKGIGYPLLSDHMSDFLASTLFNTSLLARSTEEHRDSIARFCGNVEMCRLTEQVIFAEPYFVAPNNRWTSPQLDGEAEKLRTDGELKIEIAKLKAKFCEHSQALLHADLHSGSIMATPSSTFVIDPEFAFYGPMGFDIGAFIGNVLLALFSQDGHGEETMEGGKREAYKQFLLSVAVDTWNKFAEKFSYFWTQKWHNCNSDPGHHPSKGSGLGDLYLYSVFDSLEVLEKAQKDYLGEVLSDSLGFAGAKMIRRIVGIAHVEDLESIADADVRAACEKRALACAKFLVKQRKNASLGDVEGFLKQALDASAVVA